MTVDLRRPSAELRDEIDFASAEFEATVDDAYRSELTGIVAGLRWALGDTPMAPASLRLHPHPDWREMRLEATWANEIESAVRPMPAGLTVDFVRGLASALSWASGETNITPT